MIPANALALAVFLLVIAPGYVYQRVVERFVDRRSRSALVEVVDLLCVGALCTLLSTLAVLSLGEAFPGVFLRLAELRSWNDWSTWRTVGSVASDVALASVIAGGFGGLRASVARGSAEMGAGTVWTSTFRSFTAVQAASGATALVPLFVVVRLQDGISIGGQLLMGDTAEEHDDRDLTLVSPIWMSLPGEKERVAQPHKFVIVRGSEVRLIWGYPLLDHRTPPRLMKRGRKWQKV